MDLYAVLGVGRFCGTEDIKKAWRKIARECHPDLHPAPAAAARFKEASAAHAVLVDPKQRALYDEFGADALLPGFDPIATRMNARSDGGTTAAGSSPFGDMSAFAAMFSGDWGEEPAAPPPSPDRPHTTRVQGGRARPAPEPDAHAPPWADMFSRIPDPPRRDAPGPTPGTGANAWGRRPDPAPTTPPSSGRTYDPTTGAWRDRSASPASTPPSREPTAAQRVKGTVPAMVAFTGGIATVEVVRPDGRTDGVRVHVPGGAVTGDVLRVPGMGLGHGGPPVDLLVEIDVSDHPLLRRNGRDLEMDLPVTLLEAVEGGVIVVPTPTGPARVNLPAGAAGQKLRLRGRGVQHAEGPGNLVLHVRVALPARVDATVLEAFRALDRYYDADVRDALKL
jgi:molecular chaperone DnaJ